jgi:CheY-like chemotaxis protein
MVVLYVEDDIEDFDIFCEVLASIDATIKCINARDGVEALKFLDNADILPDYVFLDINMPALDGKACLKSIKIDPRLKSIPVVIYTTSRHPMDIELCRQLGALDYLTKPSTLDAATQTISKFFKKH